MAAPREFDRETRERAMRMYQDRLAGSEYSKLAARRHVGGCPGSIRRHCAIGSRTGMSASAAQSSRSAMIRG